MRRGILLLVFLCAATEVFAATPRRTRRQPVRPPKVAQPPATAPSTPIVEARGPKIAEVRRGGVYLDVGLRTGFAPGARISAHTKGHKAGACVLVVKRASDSHAWAEVEPGSDCALHKGAPVEVLHGGPPPQGALAKGSELPVKRLPVPDRVRLAPEAFEAAALAVRPHESPQAATRGKGGSVRGDVTLLVLGAGDLAGNGGSFASARVQTRLDAEGRAGAFLGGTLGWSHDVAVRGDVAQRGERQGADARPILEARRLTASWTSAGGVQVALGRQVAPAGGASSLIDGAGVSVPIGSSLRLAAHGGLSPDVQSLRPSRESVRGSLLGGFDLGKAPWRARGHVGGVITAFGGEVDRSLATAQIDVAFGPRVEVFAEADLDLRRAGDPAVTIGGRPSVDLSRAWVMVRSRPLGGDGWLRIDARYSLLRDVITRELRAMLPAEAFAVSPGLSRQSVALDLGLQRNGLGTLTTSGAFAWSDTHDPTWLGALQASSVPLVRDVRLLLRGGAFGGGLGLGVFGSLRGAREIAETWTVEAGYGLRRTSLALVDEVDLAHRMEGSVYTWRGSWRLAVDLGVTATGSAPGVDGFVMVRRKI